MGRSSAPAAAAARTPCARRPQQLPGSPLVPARQLQRLERGVNNHVARLRDPARAAAAAAAASEPGTLPICAPRRGRSRRRPRAMRADQSRLADDANSGTRSSTKTWLLAPGSPTAIALLGGPTSVSSRAPPPLASLVINAKRYSTGPGAVSNVTCHRSAPTRVIAAAPSRFHDPSAGAAPVTATPWPSRTGHVTPSVIVVGYA